MFPIWNKKRYFASRTTVKIKKKGAGRRAPRFWGLQGSHSSRSRQSGPQSAKQEHGILTLVHSGTTVRPPPHAIWLGWTESSQTHQPRHCKNLLVMRKHGIVLCHGDQKETGRPTHRLGTAHPRLRRENTPARRPLLQ